MSQLPRFSADFLLDALLGLKGAMAAEELWRCRTFHVGVDPSLLSPRD